MLLGTVHDAARPVAKLPSPLDGNTAGSREVQLSREPSEAALVQLLPNERLNREIGISEFLSTYTNRLRMPSS